jgi:predicted RNase H-like HicB family nuclease
MEKVYYPAVLSYDDNGVSVRFPNLDGCVTSGKNVREAMTRAREAMALHLIGMEEDGDEFPAQTNPRNIELRQGEVLAAIEVYLPMYKEKMRSKSVKKTLTIPKWLNDMGEENGVNFSAVLQEALKKHMGVSERRTDRTKFAIMLEYMIKTKNVQIYVNGAGGIYPGFTHVDDKGRVIVECFSTPQSHTPSVGIDLNIDLDILRNELTNLVREGNIQINSVLGVFTIDRWEMDNHKIILES